MGIKTHLVEMDRNREQPLDVPGISYEDRFRTYETVKNGSIANVVD